MSKTIHLKKATRIEGNADVHVEIEDGKVLSARFQVHDFRGLEKFLAGRRAEFVPQLVSRICGLCSASHQIAGLMALEDALGIDVPPSVKALREVVLLGEWISSHALSYFFLSLPDVVGGGGGLFDIMKQQPEVAAKALDVRKKGQRIVELLGRRAVHPTTLGLGRFLETPSPSALAEIRSLGENLRELSADLIARVAAMGVPRNPIPFPEGQQLNFLTYDSRQDGGGFTVYDSAGRTVSRFFRHQFEENIAEMRAAWTFAKFPYLRNFGFPDGIVLTGPLARMFAEGGLLQDDDVMALPLAGQLKDISALGLDLYDTCRVLEIFQAAGKIVDLIDGVDLSEETPEADCNASGQGMGVIEAPRGILVHSYLIKQGCVERIRFLVATQFNNPFINLFVRDLAAGHVEGDRLSEDGEKLIGRCIRTFDPCLSCATH